MPEPTKKKVSKKKATKKAAKKATSSPGTAGKKKKKVVKKAGKKVTGESASQVSMPGQEHQTQVEPAGEAFVEGGHSLVGLHIGQTKQVGDTDYVKYGVHVSFPSAPGNEDETFDQAVKFVGKKLSMLVAKIQKELGIEEADTVKSDGADDFDAGEGIDEEVDFENFDEEEEEPETEEETETEEEPDEFEDFENFDEEEEEPDTEEEEESEFGGFDEEEDFAEEADEEEEEDQDWEI